MSAVLDSPPALDLPDHYEVVNGTIVENEPMSGYASEIANRLRDELSDAARRTGRGRTRMDMLFRVPVPRDRSRQREPDVAFISYDRWPEERPLPYSGAPVDVVPDLVVEVASPSNRAEEMLLKGLDYLRAGVRLVWLVYPLAQHIYAYSHEKERPRLFTETDVLDGGDVLPEFSLPVAALFPPVTDLPPSTNDE
jgi:Uma2 family endonuclease